MNKYPFPKDFFSPPAERNDEWPDEPDVRLAVEWFKTFIPQNEWHRRREAAAQRLYDAALRRIPDRKGRFFLESDTFGWYLFLAEAFIDHFWNYDPVFGSRVVPIMQSIGRNLRLLLDVEGVETRVRHLVGPERAQPNGGLFELLVAAAYRRAGATVRFVPEQRGIAKTHDIDVELNGALWAVECKRMEVGDYGDRERNVIRERWGPLSTTFAEQGRDVYADVQFRVPIVDLPESYLRDHATRYVRNRELPIAWDDRVSKGFMRPLDLRPVRAVLETDILLASGSRLVELLTGSYVRNAPHNMALNMKYADNPRYIDACAGAVVLRYESGSDVAINAKARDIGRKLSEANAQLPRDRPGIVHIGFEAVEGDRVESVRYEKMLETARNFDSEGKPLSCVYCHYFVPESPPDEAWAFDETVQWIYKGGNLTRPLQKPFLVLPDQARGRTGPHWR